MKEQWRDIAGYQGRYLVSSLGRVWSNVTCKELKLQDHPLGYSVVALTLRNGTGAKKPHLIHRLVAEAFIDNPNALPTVNHIDGNKKNNKVANLEWMSHSDNHKHAYANLGRKAHLATLLDTSRPCACLKGGVVVSTYPSATAAANALGLSNRSVSRACLGQRKTCGGYEWRYVD